MTSDPDRPRTIYCAVCDSVHWDPGPCKPWPEADADADGDRA